MKESSPILGAWQVKKTQATHNRSSSYEIWEPDLDTGMLGE